MQRDIANLKRALRDHPHLTGFLPVVAPGSVLQGMRDEYYGTEEKLSAALGEALACEYKAITDAGLIVQIDDAWLAAKYDVMVPPARFSDYFAWAEQKVEALNRALDGIPKHRAATMCAGEAGTDPTPTMLPPKTSLTLFSGEGGRLFLEMANPRHEHEWQIWQKTKLPSDRGAAARRDCAHHERCGASEARCRAFSPAANWSAVSVLSDSTDCGFAQGVFYRRVHPSIMWAKLEALAEGAKLATAELWGRAAAA